MVIPAKTEIYSNSSAKQQYYKAVNSNTVSIANNSGSVKFSKHQAKKENLSHTYVGLNT
jgi:hypothetical protein